MDIEGNKSTVQREISDSVVDSNFQQNLEPNKDFTDNSIINAIDTNYLSNNDNKYQNFDISNKNN